MYRYDHSCTVSAREMFIHMCDSGIKYSVKHCKNISSCIESQVCGGNVENIPDDQNTMGQ